MSKLWYQQPASCFDEALPIGAGRFGAMLYGKPDCEMMHLNEDSVWSGGPRSRINPDATEGFQEVRRLIRSGQIAQAEKVAFEKMQGCTPNMRHYMPLGDLIIRLELPEGEITDYRRELNLDHGIYSVSFRINGKLFQREVIASVPDDCLILHFTSEIPVTYRASIDGRDDYYDNNRITRQDGWTMLEYDGGSGSRNGIHFGSVLYAVSDANVVKGLGNQLCAENSTDVTFAFAVYTNYYHPTANLLHFARSTAQKALQKSWFQLRMNHTDDYRKLFERVMLFLPGSENNDVPTDQMVEQIKAGDFTNRNALLVTYFHYGRYLMISGSRKGSLPLNLQGIWNKDMWPAWGCRFTININTEMNYWPAEVCGLPECHLPLFELLDRVAENGTQTAREMYGQEGFCCHHNTDLWGDTAPQDLWMPATIWPTGGAWLALHIMEHYRYTQDKTFLRRYLHILHGAAQFFTGYLTENASGQLVTCPSVSPENTYRLPSGETGCLCEGPSMDSQIITQLYQDVIEADRVLGMHHALSDTVRQQLKQIPQPQIGKYGQIMEWAEDYEEPEPGHRHISQLFALHPAHQISPRKTPELAKAAAATLQRRLTHGGGHTGWSCAWIANMYARLHDPDGMMKTLTKLMQFSTNTNLLDMHPPFQIDGNFGGTAAIAEALIQCDETGILLLPACPDEWAEGEFYGFRTYGGLHISAKWKDRKVYDVTVSTEHPWVCRIRLNGRFLAADKSGNPIQLRKEADGFVCFEVVPGGVYHLYEE